MSDITLLRQQLNDWLQQADSEGWLQDNAQQKLLTIEHQQTDDLVESEDQQPLLVALMGGTGVGKSSLLNRLAGEDIATSGVQRPTSTHVTVYLHNDHQLKNNHEDSSLPLGQTNVSYHHDNKRQQIAWVDMPDIDSVAKEHHALVDQWLPYVDWLIYVVSPERYRDDIGWQKLLQRGHQHHWLFVFNQWDQGDQAQLDDFKARLKEAGFKQPIVLKTCCNPNVSIDDDFDQLENVVQKALDQHGLEQLRLPAVRARLTQLDALTTSFNQEVNGEQWTQAESEWQAIRQQDITNMEDDLKLHASAITTPGLLSLGPTLAEDLSKACWHERFEQQLVIARDKLLNLLTHKQLATQPIEPLFDDELANFSNDARQLLSDHINRALIKPGNRIQRLLNKICTHLIWLLPLASALWAGVHIVRRFYTNTVGGTNEQFLGSDFLIHAGILIALSALIPWILKKYSTPTLESSLQKALHAGAEQIATQLETRYGRLWQRFTEKRQEVTLPLEHLQSELEKGLKGSKLERGLGAFVRDN